jgi:hypothetical protein
VSAKQMFFKPLPAYSLQSILTATFYIQNVRVTLASPGSVFGSENTAQVEKTGLNAGETAPSAGH